MKQHSPRFLAMAMEAKKQIKELSPAALNEQIQRQDPPILIDVREDNEWCTGCIPGAIHLSKGVIERDIENQIPDVNQTLVVYCSGGFRSAITAESLQKMGYTNVASLEGGLRAWLDCGLPLKR